MLTGTEPDPDVARAVEQYQITTIDHPTRGRFRLPGCPVRLSASEAPTTPPPLAGEHTAEVLAEVLGLGAADVDALRAQRAIG